MGRDLGDFQTPPGLVAAVLTALGPIGAQWPRVLEPTCGRGHFLEGLLTHPSPPREIQAIEIQPDHCRAAAALLARHGRHGAEVAIACADFFGLDLRRDLSWRHRGPLLVVGNPPWVTNAELGRLASVHRPPRTNIKGLRGLAARTGSSNFDVSEAVWLKLARELAAEHPTIALLCKTSVARSILQFAHRAGLPVASASIHTIDAARWFGAAVDACLFRATLGPPSEGPSEREDGDRAQAQTDPDGGSIPVFAGIESTRPVRVMGFACGWLIADRVAHRKCSFADGLCPGTWRQGLKHDAAPVMELRLDAGSGQLRNRAGEPVDVEAEFVYPLIKGADLARPPHQRPRRAVIVTQHQIGDDTTGLAHRAPRLWSYLQAHAEKLARRKSSIYRGRPPFALFGVGPYTFAPFKVAISGLHKTPVFRAIGPIDGRPALLDDTAYLLPGSTAEEVALFAALCNDPATLDFIHAATFPDAKRPITKALLQRLDLRAVLAHTGRPRLLARAARVLREDLPTHAAPESCSLAPALDRIEHEFA